MVSIFGILATIIGGIMLIYGLVYEQVGFIFFGIAIGNLAKMFAGVRERVMERTGLRRI